MRKIRPVIGVILALLFLAICFSPQARIVLTLPDNQKMIVGESSEIVLEMPEILQKYIQMQVVGGSSSVFTAPVDSPVIVNRQSNGYEIVALKPGQVDVAVKLLGYIPVKSMAVEAIAPYRVVVGGHSIGVMLQSKGVMVVGFAPVVDENGEKVYPARDKGMQIGDRILKIDGQGVSTENDLARLIDAHHNEKMVLTVQRREEVLEVPVAGYYCSETQRYRIGLYVRDGVVGVGTLTFWDPQTHEYAALGHVIIDADTRQNIEVLSGKIVSASVQTIKPGRPGRPGEKIGIFNSEGNIQGNITKNTGFGIFGSTDEDITNPLHRYSMEVGYAHQVKKGPAQIYTVINGDDIEAFDIVIEKVYPERRNGKGMVVRIADQRLLNVTGGIIQGMSGSPIIQDNRIVGAITHVFLNDPQRGYGVFMDNMLSETSDNEIKQLNVSTKY
ncbi:MAG: SpoIVB peptidase [Syntrophomonadaceae bacterium]|jgi:stage IV sporulation protein B|nr:SpoIVB peptidase [Syntrophomonadaceae bacterium]